MSHVSGLFQTINNQERVMLIRKLLQVLLKSIRTKISLLLLLTNVSQIVSLMLSH